MDKDRLKGKAKDIEGRVKRQAGEWTGDKDLQAEGSKDQVKGKTQNVIGKVKDEGRRIADEARRDIHDIEREREKSRNRGKKAA